MNGKSRAVFFKVMAVVSALAIGGGYVLWRQSEAKKAEDLESVERAKAKEDKETLLLPGSKSYSGGTLIKEIDFIEEIDKNWEIEHGTAPMRGEQKSKVQDLLPSSKRGIIVMPNLIEPQKKDDPKLLPSSKSIDWILDNPNRKKSE